MTVASSLFGYDVLERIGEGAASTVYAVSDPRTGQVYALKHVVRRTEKDERYVAQLQNEYEVSRDFKHPVLRRAHGFKINRTLFRRVIDAAVVSELVDGVPLDIERPDNISTVLNTFIQVAQGLSALHYLRYVHCDLKPGNILLNAHGGSVKLIDFGHACRIGTEKQRVQGTPDFIAPEQVRLRPVTERTDIFNLGATLYWTLTGQRMPTWFTVTKSERDVVKEQKFPTPRELAPAVPQALSDLVMQCVKVSPLDRPAEMATVAARLQIIAESFDR